MVVGATNDDMTEVGCVDCETRLGSGSELTAAGLELKPAGTQERMVLSSARACLWPACVIRHKGRKCPPFRPLLSALVRVDNRPNASGSVRGAIGLSF